jgi:hypothetical protein
METVADFTPVVVLWVEPVVGLLALQPVSVAVVVALLTLQVRDILADYLL